MENSIGTGKRRGRPRGRRYKLNLRVKRTFRLPQDIVAFLDSQESMTNTQLIIDAVREKYKIIDTNI